MAGMSALSLTTAMVGGGRNSLRPPQAANGPTRFGIARVPSAAKVLRVGELDFRGALDRELAVLVLAPDLAFHDAAPVLHPLARHLAAAPDHVANHVVTPDLDIQT